MGGYLGQVRLSCDSMLSGGVIIVFDWGGGDGE